MQIKTIENIPSKDKILRWKGMNFILK